MSAVRAPKKSRTLNGNIPQEDGDKKVAEPIDVFCVEPSDPSITRDEVSYCLDTFMIMNNYGVGAVWLSEEKALEVPSGDGAFYFVAIFRGRVFEHLSKVGVNLYGIHVVRQTLSAGGSLPRWDFPVYALNLTGACVCFTGLSLEDREKLKTKINYMNGVVSPSLTEKVTHLVTDYCDASSKKYTEARRMRLPVMSPSWVDKAWEAVQAFSLDNLASVRTMQQYVLPIFNKMVITATGVGGSDRMEIARLIELNGGRFSGDMKRNECTHLIADQTKGVKYKKAREWNSVKVVRSSWLRKSVIAGYILPESAFDPEKRNRCSTPVLDFKTTEPEELNYSVIHGKGGRLDNSTFNTQFSNHDADVDLERPNFRRELSYHRLTESPSCLYDPIDQLEETSTRGDFDFLEGCRIWVSGVDQERLDRWKRILDRSGATRVASMEAASHVVVVNVLPCERSRLIQARSRGVHIVRAEWVVACYMQKDQLALQEFLWDPNDTVARSVCSLVSPQPFEEFLNRSGLGISPRPSGAATSSKDLGTSDYFNLAPLCNVSNDTDLSNVFRTFVFRMHDLCPDVEFQVRKEVLSAGGNVVMPSDNSAHVNYLVCDQIEFEHLKAKGSFDEAVTAFWVKKCLMDRCILKPSDHPLYRPLPAVEKSTVFSGAVIVVSCFGDYERFTLCNLIKRFGGTVQETLTRKIFGDQLAVTHVIGGSEGARVIEARRQKFKVVDPSWVIESIINDKLMKEDQFPLKGEAYASYKGRTDDLWPEAFKVENNTCSHGAIQAASLGSKDLRSSDHMLNELQVECQEQGSFPYTRSSELCVGENVLSKDDFKNLMPMSSVPGRLHTSKLYDRFLDMKQPYKANFRGLSQVMPSPLSSNADISTDSLSMSAVGVILKEAAIKTACTNDKYGRNNVPSAPIEMSNSMARSMHNSSSKLRNRKSVSCKKSMVLANEVASLHECNPPICVGNDMMALRARMTERLEQRNREIANQLIEIKSAKPVSVSVCSTQEIISSRRRKYPHISTNGDPSVKRTSQSLTPPPQESTAYPLIEWQPAMPSRLSSSTLHGFDEPLDVTPLTISGENGSTAISRRGSVSGKPVEKCFRYTQEIVESMLPAVPSSQVSGNMEVKRSHSDRARDFQVEIEDVTPEFRDGQTEQALSKKFSEAKEVLKPELPLERVSSIKQERMPTIISSTVRRFMFTSVTPQERLRLSNIITHLGGIVDQGELSDDCTHLICGKLIRGSKLMGCIASGRWVLGADYIDRSFDAGKWLSEVDFEVGSPTRLWAANLSERESKLAQACRRWRLKLANIDPSKRLGAFHKWRCVLYCSDEKAAGLLPMLRAGGAEVAVRKNGEGAPLAFRPTHAVVCVCNMWNMEELELLVRIGAKVFNLDYISKFLLDEHVEECTSYHADYKKYLLQRRM